MKREVEINKFTDGINKLLSTTKVEKALLALVALSLPFGHIVATKFIAILIIYVAYIAIKYRRFCKKEAHTKLLLSIPIIFFILHVVSIFLSINQDFLLLEKRLLLIILPITFFFVKEITKEDLNDIMSFFVYGCFTAVFICLFTSFFKSVYIGSEGTLMFNAAVLQEKPFLESISQGGNYFFGSDLSIFIHSGYFSMYLIFSLAIIYFKFKNKVFENRTLFIFSIGLIVVFIFLLSSKINIILQFFLFAIIILDYFTSVRVSIMHKLLISILGLIFFASIFYFNPRGKVFYDTISFQKVDSNTDEGYRLRLMSWEVAIDVIKKNFLMGSGLGDTENRLLAEYERKNYRVPFLKRHNAHNQFLETQLALGIGGSFLLIVLLIGPVIINKSKWLTNMFLLIFLINILVESMFNRFAGVAYFCYFYSVFITRFNSNVSNKMVT